MSEFERKLDAALEMMQQGSLEEALAQLRGSEEAAQGEALLRLAHELPQGSTLDPSDLYIRNAKARLLNQVPQHIKKAPRSHKAVRPGRRYMRRPAFVLASLAVIFVLGLSGIWATTASAAALPGDVLYPLKLAGEEVDLALSFTAEGDAALLVEQATERLSEVQALIEAGRPEQVGATLQAYGRTLARLDKRAPELSAGGAERPLLAVLAALQRQSEHLNALQQKLPPQAQAQVGEAIRHISHSQQVLEQMQSGGNPSDLAPGQLKKGTEKPENEHGKPDKNKPKDKTPGPNGTPGPEFKPTRTPKDK